MIQGILLLKLKIMIPNSGVVGIFNPWVPNTSTPDFSVGSSGFLYLLFKNLWVLTHNDYAPVYNVKPRTHLQISKINGEVIYVLTVQATSVLTKASICYEMRVL